MTISALAQTGGVGVETVRYYQRRGLLPTPDRAGGHRPGGGIRRYDESDARKLRFIRAAQAAGFTLEEIATLLSLDVTDDRSRARVMAVARIAALNQRIAELKRAQTSLSRLARECSSGAAGPCPILNAFEAV